MLTKFKNLAKNMNVIEKAKILFENINSKNDGISLLSQQEEDEIYYYAKISNEISTLNNLGKLFNTKGFLIPKIIISFLELKNLFQTILRINESRFDLKHFQDSDLFVHDDESLIISSIEKSIYYLKYFRKFEYMTNYLFKLAGFEFLSENEINMFTSYNEFIDKYYIPYLLEIDFKSFHNYPNIDKNLLNYIENGFINIFGVEDQTNAKNELFDYLKGEGYKF